MIHTIEIDSIEGLLPLLSEQNYVEGIDRNRSRYLYRGMPDARYQLFTSLSRNCKEESRKLEPIILKNFVKYAAIDEPGIERSVWQAMILGQHHGLPTRLLDWSLSPLVGLNFAMTERNLAKMHTRDCAVWRLDMTEIHSMLPPRYQQIQLENSTDVFSVDMLSEVAGSLAQYDADMGSDKMVVIEPPSIDHRIVNQFAFFTAIPLGMTDIEAFLQERTDNTVKYIIKKEIRWRVRDMLDQLNMNERIVYPGLDGLSTWLARHYYVK